MLPPPRLASLWFLAPPLLACGSGGIATIGGGDGPIAIEQFCDELIDAGCDYGDRCGGVPADRAECRAELVEEWDECPFMQQAVSLGEAEYDPAAARTLVEDVREATCGGNPVPDPVTEVPVFTPQQALGQLCHSDVSCESGLVCEEHTVATPEGTCAPST